MLQVEKGKGFQAKNRKAKKRKPGYVVRLKEAGEI